jgi:hypothetical protein
MMDTPRLNKNQCNPLQNGKEARFRPSDVDGLESPENQGATAGAHTFHSISTAAGFENHSSDVDLTQTSHAQEQKPHTPVDAIRRRQFEQRLDQLMVRFLLQLSTISQVKAAPTELQAADSNAVRLPVSTSGRALTEDPVGQLAAEYKHASGIKDAKKRVSIKVQIATRAQTEIRSCKYSRRHAPDLGTQDGRLAVAAYALEHGTRRAAETYCRNPDDPRSVKSMQRNVQRYLVELKKVRGIA